MLILENVFAEMVKDDPQNACFGRKTGDLNDGTICDSHQTDRGKIT